MVLFSDRSREQINKWLWHQVIVSFDDYVIRVILEYLY